MRGSGSFFRLSHTRQLALHALAALDGSDPSQVTPVAWRGISKVLSDIRSVSPTVDVDEIKRRANNYPTRSPRSGIPSSWPTRSKNVSAPMGWHGFPAPGLSDFVAAVSVQSQ